MISVHSANATNISVWPNPFNENIKMKIQTAFVPGNTVVKLFTATGETVLVKRINIGGEHDLIEIGHVQHLPPGLYILQVVSGSKMIFKTRLIKKVSKLVAGQISISNHKKDKKQDKSTILIC